MDKDYFLLKDKIKEIESSFHKDGWVTIYQSDNNGLLDHSLVYCCIVDSRRIKEYKTERDWGIRPGYEGKPSVFTTYKKGKEIDVYEMYSDKGIEPFIFSKHFSYNDGYEKYIDISEEFILYFKLYERGENKQNRQYYFIDELGELEEVITVKDNLIKIKLKYLKEYLAVRRVYFSVCFDCMRFSKSTIEELDIAPIDKDFIGLNFNYNHLIRPMGFIESGETQSWILGKVIIPYDKKKETGYKQKYEEYIIGYDDKGKEKLLDCKKENNKYFIVTYFRRDVLNKYYNEPTKYEVTAMYVNSKFFTLKIDNNNEDYVAVFLIELGMLPYKEQLHWKQYNILPQKGISQSYFKTMIKGEWNQHPETPDLYFKHKFKEFNNAWEEKFSWKFYKPLSKVDEHYFISLHIPTTNNIKAFCEQTLSLVKITIDSINEEKIADGLTIEKDEKGLTKLEKFLKSKGLIVDDMLVFLRHLMNLRSGLIAHRFSESNKKLKKSMDYFGIKTDNYDNLIDVAKEIFIKSINTLNTLETYFLK